MNLLDRFSTHLRDILARSIKLASDLHNPAVEPIHLFFALLNQPGSVGAELLGRFSITVKTVEQAILGLPVEGGDRGMTTPRGATAEKLLSPLSGASKAVLERALVLAHDHRHNYIGTEHLLAALLESNDAALNQILTANQVPFPELKRQVAAVLASASSFPQLNEVAEVVERLEESVQALSPPAREESKPSSRPSKKKETALDWFATHLTSPEAQTRLDPVIGREREIERVIQILCRRTKNNPLLLGDPGVGKTAIVEGLAKRIVEGKVPELLLNKKIYALDLGLLIAGTIYRGEFEGRLRQVIEEVAENPNIILFIDEIHNIVGAGSAQGTMDAANLLKPALARGALRCIGATTPGDYKKHLEADPALERRFQAVYAKEPSLEETVAILEGIKGNFERFHGVKIMSEAVRAAARLSDRHLPNKFLPDKAIDLLDETAAAKRLGLKASPVAARRSSLERELERLVASKEEAARADRFGEAVELKKEEDRLRAELKALVSRCPEGDGKPLPTVRALDVATQLAAVTGTAPAELLQSAVDELKSLEAKLAARVIGQATVIAEVAALIRQARLGLSHPERPLASFLFVGESGVGKTELGKTLAAVLYHDSDALIKLDMSEFNEAFSVSKLLGAPAGYVGYKEGTHLTDRVKLHPHCVILFDEIDKAHREVVKLLLQILETGELTDATGKKISLRQAIIILTTSLGAGEAGQGAFGFGSERASRGAVRARLVDKLKEYFSPEVINRLDKVCVFEPLGRAELVAIAALEIDRLNERLAAYRTAVVPEPRVLNWLVAQLSDKAAGARDLRRQVRAEVEELVAELLLKHKFHALKQHYTVALKGAELIVK